MGSDPEWIGAGAGMKTFTDMDQQAWNEDHSVDTE